MKNTRKRQFITRIAAIALAVIGFSMTACDDSNGDDKSGKDGVKNSNALVGKWYSTQQAANEGISAVYEFTNDGKLLTGGQDQGFTYTVSGNTLTVKLSGHVFGTATFNISGTVLTLSNACGPIAAMPYYKAAGSNGNNNNNGNSTGNGNGNGNSNGANNGGNNGNSNGTDNEGNGGGNSNSTVINIAAIQGVAAPVTGETPVNEIYDYENGQYSGFVTWSPNHYTFEASTIYTATITLTAETGYTLQGIGNNFFTVTGAKSVSNNANSGVITAIFPQTAATLSLDKIEYYWIDQHGSLATTSGGAVAVGVGETLTITAQSAGYTAKQWYRNGISTGQNGNTYIFSSVVAGNHIVSWVVEKNGKVYSTNITIAVKNKLTVIFDINGGTGTTPDLKTVIVGSSITLPSGSEFTKAGYAFGGWNTNASGTGYNYNAGTSYTPSNNITLYAKWNDNRLGTQGNPIELNYGYMRNDSITDDFKEKWYTIIVTGNGTMIGWKDYSTTDGTANPYTLFRAEVYVYDENYQPLDNPNNYMWKPGADYKYYYYLSPPGKTGKIYIKVIPYLYVPDRYNDGSTNGTFAIGASRVSG